MSNPFKSCPMCGSEMVVDLELDPNVDIKNPTTWKVVAWKCTECYTSWTETGDIH